jgi:hypothetical protein
MCLMTQNGHQHEIRKKNTYFLRLNYGSENVTNPVLVVVNLPPIVLQVVVLLSSVFDEWG